MEQGTSRTHKRIIVLLSVLIGVVAVLLGYVIRLNKVTKEPASIVPNVEQNTESESLSALITKIDQKDLVTTENFVRALEAEGYRGVEGGAMQAIDLTWEKYVYPFNHYPNPAEKTIFAIQQSNWTPTGWAVGDRYVYDVLEIVPKDYCESCVADNLASTQGCVYTAPNGTIDYPWGVYSPLEKRVYAAWFADGTGVIQEIKDIEHITCKGSSI